MSAQVQRDQSKLAPQIGVQLTVPAEPRLREAVYEKYRSSARIACFDDVQLETTAAGHLMVSHRMREFHGHSVTRSGAAAITSSCYLVLAAE